MYDTLSPFEYEKTLMIKGCLIGEYEFKGDYIYWRSDTLKYLSKNIKDDSRFKQMVEKHLWNLS